MLICLISATHDDCTLTKCVKNKSLVFSPSPSAPPLRIPHPRPPPPFPTATRPARTPHPILWSCGDRCASSCFSGMKSCVAADFVCQEDSPRLDQSFCYSVLFGCWHFRICLCIRLCFNMFPSGFSICTSLECLWFLLCSYLHTASPNLRLVCAWSEKLFTKSLAASTFRMFISV